MIDMHTISTPRGFPAFHSEKVVHGTQANVATAAAGAGVSVAIPFTGLDLPADASGNGLYSVHVTPNQDATAFVTAKTATGFIVHLSPRLAASSLVVGTMDVIVTY